MTFITVTQQRAAINVELATVTDMTKVCTASPRALQDTELPACFAHAGEATFNRTDYGVGSLLVRRQWEVRVYAADAGLKAEYAAEQAAEDLMAEVAAVLAGKPRLEVAETPDINRVFDMTLDRGGDTGVVGLALAEKEYAGFVIRFFTEVEELIADTAI